MHIQQVSHCGTEVTIFDWDDTMLGWRIAEKPSQRRSHISNTNKTAFAEDSLHKSFDHTWLPGRSSLEFQDDDARDCFSATGDGVLRNRWLSLSLNIPQHHLGRPSPSADLPSFGARADIHCTLEMV